MPESLDLKPVRRVVTGHDRAGRAVIQSDGAPALRPKSERGGIELLASVPQVGSESVLDSRALVHPVSHLTMIMSLLY